MRNSASALALQLCLDFDQPIVPAKPVDPVTPEPTLFTATVVDAVQSSRDAPLDFVFAAGRTLSPSWKGRARSEEHTSELQSLMRISYAVFCLKKKKKTKSKTSYIIKHIALQN